MAELIITAFVSLDGVMEAPGGGDHRSAGWTFQLVEPDMAAYELKGREQEEAGSLLLGRQTYEEFAPVWGDMAEFERYNSLPKYVVSTTLQESDERWPAEILRSVDDVAALKAQDAAPIYVHGSAKLGASLAAAGLVDRYNLLVFPVLLGAGKKLFGDADQAATKLSLVEHEVYANGIQKQIFDVIR